MTSISSSPVALVTTNAIHFGNVATAAFDDVLTLGSTGYDLAYCWQLFTNRLVDLTVIDSIHCDIP